MDGRPRSGPSHHRGLLVVGPDRGRNPARAFERRVVHRQPYEQVLALAPQQRPRPRERQGEQEREQIAPRAAHPHSGERRPVALGLNPGRRLNTTSSPTRRRRIGPANIALHRAKTRRIVVLGNQPRVKRRDVARRILPAHRHVCLDRPVEPGRDRLLARTSVRDARRLAAAVVAHRAFRHPQQTSNVPVRPLFAYQAIDRHPILPTELGHAPPPSSRTETKPWHGASRPGRCDSSISVNRRVPVRGGRCGCAHRRRRAWRGVKVLRGSFASLRPFG